MLFCNHKLQIMKLLVSLAKGMLILFVKYYIDIKRLIKNQEYLQHSIKN